MTITKAPLWDTRDLATSEIELAEPLNSLESEWVIGRLMTKDGIVRVAYACERRVFIEYDASVVSTADIVSFLYVCGLTATRRRSTSGCRGQSTADRSSV